METDDLHETMTSFVVTYGDFWAWMIDFVRYLDNHNQTSDTEEIIQSLVAHNESVYMEVLTLLLQFMSRHGFPDEFPDEGSDLFDAEQRRECNLSQLSPKQDSTLKSVSFCLEGVVQAVVGVAGIVGNIVAMKIFLSGRNKFNTIFYRLLLCLLLSQTCFISLSLFTFLILYKKTNFYFNLVFSNGLYPLPPLMLHISTILTVLMAW